MSTTPVHITIVLALFAVPVGAIAQFRQSLGQSTTVEYTSHFAFTRLRYGQALGGFGGATWAHDYPSADRNISYIVDYITNMRVHLEGTNVLQLNDPRIFENPILYVSEPGYWRLGERDAEHLRSYLLKGGFVIFDDFEGPHFDNMAAQMQRAVPEYGWLEIDVSHPIFQTFFEMPVLDVPHPSMAVRPRFMAMFEQNDPRRRMLALANHNSDLAEYWEWSAEGLFNPDPTNNSYRLGVNYIVYGMTH